MLVSLWSADPIELAVWASFLRRCVRFQEQLEQGDLESIPSVCPPRGARDGIGAHGAHGGWVKTYGNFHMGLSENVGYIPNEIAI